MAQIDLPEHARMRLDARRIPATAVEMALLFGRERRLNGETFFAIGRREVERFTGAGVDLKRYEGIHVVCAEDDVVVTAYRNRHFAASDREVAVGGEGATGRGEEQVVRRRNGLEPPEQEES